MVRLEDVARAAGVSRATVSNVFNKPDLVRPEVRERVRAAALTLGYNGPDPTARAFRGGKVNAIAFILGSDPPLEQIFTNPYARDFFSGVGAACDEHGAGLALVSDLGREAFWGIRNAIADGFILQRSADITYIEAARNRRLPFVVLDEDPGPDVSSVQIDDRDGARQAAEHLVALGHRRFAIMSVLRADPAVLRARGEDAVPIYHPGARRARTLVEPSPVEHQRLAGYADALTAAGISIDSVPIVEAVSFSTPAAMSGAALLLDKAADATAILTMSDVQALAVLAEARKRNIRIPQDLSVVGFDDNPEAAISDPPLTTMAQPVADKGRAAAQILFEDGGPQKIVLPVKLVVRASTAPPAAVAGRKRARPAEARPHPTPRTIGMVLGGDLGIVQTFMNPYVRELLAGIAEVCDQHDARLVILSQLNPTDVGQPLADGYIVQQRDALSLFPAAVDGPRQVVLLDDDAGGAASSVRVADRDGARQAAEHLIRLGHRRFAIAAQSKRHKSPGSGQPAGRNTGPTSGTGFQIDVAASYLTADPVYRAPTVGALTMEGLTPVQVARFTGFADALSTAGIEINRVPMVEMRSYTVASAMSGAALLLDKAPEATAILTLSDVQALAIVAEAQSRGIRVPDDLSVVGYDDNPEAAASDPPLTTVVQPVREKGRMAARILFEGARNVVLPEELIVRGSTAAPRRV